MKEKGGPKLKELCNAKKNIIKVHVLKLKKSIYGIKQAAKQWHKKLKSVLASCGCTPTDSDPCLFFMEGANGYRVFILV